MRGGTNVAGCDTQPGAERGLHSTHTRILLLLRRRPRGSRGRPRGSRGRPRYGRGCHRDRIARREGAFQSLVQFGLQFLLLRRPVDDMLGRPFPGRPRHFTRGSAHGVVSADIGHREVLSTGSIQDRASFLDTMPHRCTMLRSMPRGHCSRTQRIRCVPGQDHRNVEQAAGFRPQSNGRHLSRFRKSVPRFCDQNLQKNEGI